MELSPDAVVFWKVGFVTINLTLVTTWVILFFLALGSKIISSKLVDGIPMSRWQGFLEMVVVGIKKHMEEIGVRRAEDSISFVGTLFVFLATSSLFAMFPWYRSPTGSLSTTAALALAVFLSVISFGVRKKGLVNYLKGYLEPTAIMLPFNVLGEISRTIALAVRLFGNMMSGEMIVSILLTITPFFFPTIMNIFGLFIGMVQAYIFAVLATVYIAAAIQIDLLRH